MAAKRSAGILLYRPADGDNIEVLIVHMGGPFWAHKDLVAWSIPKGEYVEGEEPLAVARREFGEELGSPVPPGELLELGTVKQPSGKLITAWALDADFDPTTAVSNTFVLEWPKGSGEMRESPKSTAPNGSTSRPPAPSSSEARSSSSTVCSSSSPDRDVAMTNVCV